MKKFSVLVMVMAILLTTLAFSRSVVAQESNLSPEEQALIEGSFQALQAMVDNTATYTMNGSETTGVTSSVTEAEQVLVTESQEYALKVSSQVILTPENRLSYFILTGHRLEVSGNEIDYSLKAEMRLVDGLLYIKANYSQPDSALPAIPEGWAVISDPDEWAGLDDLRLDSFLDYGAIGFDVAAIPDYTSNYLTNALKVTEEISTLDDGREVRLIIVSLSPAGIIQEFEIENAGKEDAETLALLDFYRTLDESSTWIHTFYLDPETGVYLGQSGDIALMVKDYPLSKINSAAPESYNLSLTFRNETRSIIMTLDTPLEPVEAPEDVDE